jgi:hypothetical protein
VPVEEPLAADDDDSADASTAATVEEPTPEPATPRPKAAKPRARPKPRPARVDPTPTPAPVADPTPAVVAEALPRARVRMSHSPPRFMVLGSLLTLEVTVKLLNQGRTCEPRVILAPKKRKKYRRYKMVDRGSERWSATVDVPYDEEWAAGVRYFVECCWDDDCDERWKSPATPHYLYPPDF